jgi:hypothetical protein
MSALPVIPSKPSLLSRTQLAVIPSAARDLHLSPPERASHAFRMKERRSCRLRRGRSEQQKATTSSTKGRCRSFLSGFCDHLRPLRSTELAPPECLLSQQSRSFPSSLHSSRAGASLRMTGEITLGMTSDDQFPRRRLRDAGPSVASEDTQDSLRCSQFIPSIAYPEIRYTRLAVPSMIGSFVE